MRRAAVAALLALGCGQMDGPALQIVGESTKVRAGDALPATSPFFDGETVTLRGARGEVLGLQVLRTGQGLAPLQLSIDGAVVEAFAVGYLPATRPSTGMYGDSAGAGRYPDRLTPSEGPTPGPAVFFEVTIARDARSGIHHGQLRVGERLLPVTLEIEAVAIEPVSLHPKVWGYYNPVDLATAVGVAPGSDDAWLVERAVYALFRGHGVYASPEFTLEDVDRRLPLADGIGWIPILLPTDHRGLVAAVAAWNQRLEGDGHIAFAIPIDEPRRLVRKLVTRVLATWAREGGSGDKVRFAVTHEPHFVLGDAIDLYISPLAPRLGESRGHWTYNGTPPWAGSMILDAPGTAMRTWGWIGWRWQVPVWYIWNVLYWRDKHNGRLGEPALARLEQDAVTFDDGEDHGNLDGVLAFPGPLPSLRLKALRRGLQDRLLLEQLETCRGRGAAEAIAASLVPVALGDATRGREASWPEGEQDWEEARRRVLDGLRGCE